MNASIETMRLSKAYGPKLALDALDLQVGSGLVFGFLGPNGAGKTTTLRLLLGYLRPTQGTARVLGLDPWREPVALRQRTGYVPGDFSLYENLTVRQYFRFVDRLRGKAHLPEAESLAKRLRLSMDDRARTLSRGGRQKVGLIQAMMHRPDLLLLDEPTSGLDPLVQREVRTLFREIRNEGRTVFLSSHILPEVERVCDRVAIIHEGKLRLVEDLDKLRQHAPRPVEITFHGPISQKALAGIANVDAIDVVDDVHVHCVVRGDMEPFLKAIAPLRVSDLVTREPSLEELFLGSYGGAGGDASA